MYDQIAEYYDLTHAELIEDIPFILQLAQEQAGAVLELGCGSGRLLLPLAKASISITGIDNSGAMLQRARQKIALEPTAVLEKITLIQEDMSHFHIPDEMFALVVVPYNTFMHLDSKTAVSTLRCIKKCLAGNGRLLIDLANPFTIANTPEDQLISLENHIIHPQTGDHILHMASNRLDDEQQQLHITWIYDRSPANGGAVQRTIAQAIYHYRYPHQIELLLHETGFKLASLWGDYDQSPFTEDSPRLLILAQT